ncbi:hypothetical protein [Chryseobacterium taklimakanense]|uniref:Lipoprotein n=1 Tax=Chryseobacterium taklimakanense TaxID=536441 RepID=A0A3G8WUQ2_9FLAO|nr:hypothetical protein [Chryseobacterium taklimakanense]AZI19466.1 hypothetical protein EIH08_00895 [Chryseobacterium taklimakanense]
MKKIILTIIGVTALSCSKKQEIAEESSVTETTVLPYDTTAIDSFAPGANPGNVIINRVAVDSSALAKNDEQKTATKIKKEEADKKAKLDDETKKKAEESEKKKKADKLKRELGPPMQNTEPAQ